MKTADASGIVPLQEYLADNAGRFFPALADRPVKAQLTQATRRRFSHNYFFTLLADGQRHDVFVKVPVASAAQECLSSNGEPEGHTAPEDRAVAGLPTEPPCPTEGLQWGLGIDSESLRIPPAPQDRPRLVPLLPISREVELEHAALIAMGKHFAQISDPQLQAPRVLGATDAGAIVIQSVRLPTLADVIRRSNPWRVPPADNELFSAFHLAGRWLNVFHGMPQLDHAQPRLDSRDQLVQQFEEFSAYLVRTGGPQGLLDKYQAQFTDVVEAVLPIDLPLVTGHGDFGLHNIFFGRISGGQTAAIGFDTLACWQTSAYEDLAYFLLLLETLPPLFVRRSVACREATVLACRREFLRGYFGSDAVPLDALRLYEILVAMDKWVSAVHSARRATGLRGVVKKCRLALQHRALHGRIEKLFSQSRPTAAELVTARPRELETAI